jgi:hypothetical protein
MDVDQRTLLDNLLRLTLCLLPGISSVSWSAPHPRRSRLSDAMYIVCVC